MIKIRSESRRDLASVTTFEVDTAQYHHHDCYSAHDSHKLVRCFCAAPRANIVELLGDFDHWQPLPRLRSMAG